MYKSFYGLKEKPFNLTPDPDYLFMSRGHEEAYTHLEYAITENKGFVVITGEIGSGKTTLINFLLRKLKQNIQVAVVNQTIAHPKQFLKLVCQEFELAVDVMDKAEMLDTFQNFLLQQFAEKKRVALIIDESQNLPNRTIEEIRMLSNLESEKHHLIQILLLGQPELKDKLQKKSLEQFTQRVTVYWHLYGLDKDEVKEYIRHRLWVAGAEELDIFDQQAIESIHKHSRGIPRLINILCDASLVHGYADELKVITSNVIDEVVKVRNIGGILDEKKEVTKESSSSFPKKYRNDHLSQRMQAIEKKIKVVENTLKRINIDLDSISSDKHKRDELVLELTKMLKQSMESQANLMLELIELKHKEKGDDLINNIDNTKGRITALSNPSPNQPKSDAKN
ncbi:MAG: AAA family ATPase [Deltaproteobacteria bacterium]|nr:AAA family ATPase [Deltaproteobacteria bacterium]